MTKLFKTLLCLLVMLVPVTGFSADSSESIDRFMVLWERIHDQQNGYFSPDGAPYHSVETLMVEAPDHGHETTSEAYSYWIWLEAMYGRVTGDWTYLNTAWTTMEQHIIPTDDLQPNNSAYNPQDPATYAAEYSLPDYYPSELQFDVTVGVDPISDELAQTYGTYNIYGMHWLLDCDNFYGYGNKGDGVSTPSYINTFQRGEQESTWETVPHPSWEAFNWGGPYGFLDLFTGDSEYSQQWRYTNAPDADARAVQAIYWANQWADDPSDLPIAKASKMGDYLRLAMFDKYFMQIGAQAKTPGTGYDSAHKLLAWYYAWGGSTNSSSQWAWRIGSSHCHFGYQNPVAAYALSSDSDFVPDSPNAQRDWTDSLQRQIEFYRWLQSDEGAIAGGATNSWNGAYEAYPSGKSTFYGMAYDDNPVYHDPGSNTWFGMQAWSMERMCELYYITNDDLVREIVDKWITWVKTEITVSGSSWQIPVTLDWSGEPDTWDAANPGANSNLHVTVVDYGQDVGITGCLAKALTYYAAATRRWKGEANMDTESKEIAKGLLDALWANLDSIGVAVEEEREDYSRFFEQEVYIPSGWSGTMANGDVIQSGVTFIDIRSDYRNDPDFAQLEDDYTNGRTFSIKYHRFWAQTDVALALAEYGYFFELTGEDSPEVSITSPADNANFTIDDEITVEVSATDADGTITEVTLLVNSVEVGSTTTTPYSFDLGTLAVGTYTITAKATDNDGNEGTSTPITITVTETPVIAPVVTITSPADGDTFQTDDDISVDVSATDADGTVESVTLYVNSVEMGSVTTAPYFFDLGTLPVGTYVLYAEAVDNDGNVGVSPTVTIEVTDSGQGDLVVTWILGGSWESNGQKYFQADVIVENNGTVASGWALDWTWPGGQSIGTNYWNVLLTQIGSQVHAEPHAEWNRTINPGSSVNFGGIFEGDPVDMTGQITVTAQ